MNTLEINIKKSSNDSYKSFLEIQLMIDGINLIEVIRKIEEPFAKTENHPDLAGSYQGLNLKFIENNHFLGNNPFYGEDEDKTALLDCPCGCEGCWTLAARITISDDKVIWDNFEQVHRNGEIDQDNIWDYGKLFFHFEKDQYLKELEKLKKRGLGVCP